MVLNGNSIRWFPYVANKYNYFLSLPFQAYLEDTKTNYYFIFLPNLIKKCEKIEHEVMKNYNFWRVLARKKMFNSFIIKFYDKFVNHARLPFNKVITEDHKKYVLFLQGPN